MGIEKHLLAPFHRMGAKRLLNEFHSQDQSTDQLVQWAMNFGSRGLYKIGAVQVCYEITELVKEVQAIKPKVIVEIGTARGGTALLWANCASQQFITCDLVHPPTTSSIIKEFPHPGSNCSVTLLAGDSHQSDFCRRVEDELAGEPVDFLFIDGDHSREGVEQDYNDYRHLVREGGLIAFHDIADEQPYENEVQYFWKKVKEGQSFREIIKDKNQIGFGIGVLYV